MASLCQNPPCSFPRRRAVPPGSASGRAAGARPDHDSMYAYGGFSPHPAQMAYPQGTMLSPQQQWIQGTHLHAMGTVAHVARPAGVAKVAAIARHAPDQVKTPRSGATATVNSKRRPAKASPPPAQVAWAQIPVPQILPATSSASAPGADAPTRDAIELDIQKAAPPHPVQSTAAIAEATATSADRSSSSARATSAAAVEDETCEPAREVDTSCAKPSQCLLARPSAPVGTFIAEMYELDTCEEEENPYPTADLSAQRKPSLGEERVAASASASVHADKRRDGEAQAGASVPPAEPSVPPAESAGQEKALPSPQQSTAAGEFREWASLPVSGLESLSSRGSKHASSGRSEGALAQSAGIGMQIGRESESGNFIINGVARGGPPRHLPRNCPRTSACALAAPGRPEPQAADWRRARRRGPGVAGRPAGARPAHVRRL